MNILIPGGHLTPALALIDHLKKTHPQLTVVFVGRTHSQKQNQQPAQERSQVIKRTNVIFEPFDSGKWGVGGIGYRLQQIGLTLTAILKALVIIQRYQPKVVVSFGGYLALPLAIAAKALGVPVITHEQTRVAGLANQLIAKIANQVAISYPESYRYFPAKKTVLTGNLIRQALTQPAPKPSWFKLSTKKPILYITGGSQGSEIINQTVANAIQPLLKDWIVIHQCGPKSKKRNYLKELTIIKQNLPPKLKSHYFVFEWLDETELAWVYQHAKLVIGRAGANTVSEIKLYQLPAIFIPLTLARHNEQLKNAQPLQQATAAVIIEQKELSGDNLLTTINQIRPKLTQMKQNFLKLPKELNGTPKLTQLIESYLTK